MKTLAVAVLVFAISGCVSWPYTDVPLTWKPTSDLHYGSTTLTGIFAEKFKILPFTDTRSNPKEIARNTEEAEAKTVTTKDDVATWCTGRFISILQQYGITTTESDETVRVKSEILNFYVTEDSLYRASVGLRITVEDTSGKILWKGLASGTAKRFGRSYSMENYYEALSDAYVEAVNNFLGNPELAAELKSRGKL